MRYFIIAGEASGDLHASALMRELKIVDPSAEFCFLGGDLMSAQGGKRIKHYRQMAFMGFWNVLKNARTVLKNIKDCKAALLEFFPDIVILVDYPSFNLRIARFVKENSKTPVYYYISPKIWAWKEFRIKQIRKYVDKMFTIFPFETAFYEKHQYKVEYVGNPTVDAVGQFSPSGSSFSDVCAQHHLSGQPIIVLLAGSRKQEIVACLPRMLASALRFSDFQCVIAGAPGIDPDFYRQMLNQNPVPVVFGKTYELLHHARAAIVNSGTATLETALLGTPQVVVYHVLFGRLAFLIKDWFIRVKYFSLVNLMAQKEVVKELVAHHFTVDKVSRELNQLLYDEKYRNQMIASYNAIKKELGDAGAAKRTAETIVKS